MNDPRREETQHDGIGGIVKRVLSPGPTAEERLEELLAERRRELDETAARFDASIADLERREELLRDSRASVERMLRLGRTDLEARENELTEFLRDLGEREARVADAEAQLAQRRQELGAVELKRAAVERRERELEGREAELAEREAELEEREAELPEREAALREAELPEREAALRAAATRETPAPQPHEVSSSPGEPAGTELVFVPGVEYRIFELGVPTARVGGLVEVAGSRYEIVRIGPSPLPGDARRCAYLAAARSRQTAGDA